MSQSISSKRNEYIILFKIGLLHDINKKSFNFRLKAVGKL